MSIISSHPVSPKVLHLMHTWTLPYYIKHELTSPTTEQDAHAGPPCTRGWNLWQLYLLRKPTTAPTFCAPTHTQHLHIERGLNSNGLVLGRQCRQGRLEIYIYPRDIFSYLHIACFIFLLYPRATSPSVGVRRSRRACAHRVKSQPRSSPFISYISNGTCT